MSSTAIGIIVSGILTSATIGIGIYQFNIQQIQSNREPFLRKQLELYFEASDAIARLATEINPNEWEKARKDFWRLYWGTLSVVEDPKIESAMVELGERIPDQPGTYNLPRRDLQQPSLDFAHVTRDLILTTWNVDLPPLKGKRPNSQPQPER